MLAAACSLALWISRLETQYDGHLTPEGDPQAPPECPQGRKSPSSHLLVRCPPGGGGHVPPAKAMSLPWDQAPGQVWASMPMPVDMVEGIALHFHVDECC